MKTVIKLYDQAETECFYQSDTMIGYGLKDLPRREMNFNINMGSENIFSKSPIAMLKIEWEAI